MSTTRFGVRVPKSYVHAGPDSHYIQCADGFDTAIEAIDHAYDVFGCKHDYEFILEEYDATGDIAFEAYYESLDAAMEFDARAIEEAQYNGDLS